MKILHTSDWHLGRRPVGGVGLYSNERYEDYFKAAEYIVNEAVKKKVDVVIIAGDLFDKCDISPETLYKAERLLNVLKENGINVLAIEGNHDQVSTYQESWIWYLEKKELAIFPKCFVENERFKFIPVEIDGIKFFGISYQSNLNEKALCDLSQSLDKGENIVIIHTAIVNDLSNTLLPGCVTKEIINTFSNKVLYIAAGHFHSFYKYPSTNPYFFIPGAPEYWDLNEKGQKGYIIFDTDSREYTFYPSKKRKISTHRVNIDNYENFVANLDVEKGEIINLEINSASGRYPNVGWIEGELLSKGALKVNVKVIFEGQVFNSKQLKNLSKEEIEKQIIKSWGNIFSKNADDTSKLISTLKKTEKEKDLIDIFDEFLNKVLEGGKDDN